ncbi:MAG: lysophospholipid acyltransferase family protein [Muribaculaceae bacterium]|nr:lysophospholipid acyltransferase family protein [Muribaculaceae bacterium]
MNEKILLGCLKGLARLPLGILYLFSDLASFILYHIVKYRRKMVWKNLTASFPLKSEKELKHIEKEFYGYLGDQIVETLKLLHISDLQLKRRVKVINYNGVNEVLEEGKNVVLLMGHYGNWEWVQEISRYFLPHTFMASIYHPLSNKIWENIFIKMRSRWGAHIVPMKKATRVLLNRDNQPWVCGFIADAYTWRKHEDNCIDFLNHKTWFIYGPEEIGRKTGAEYFYLEMRKLKRGYYEIEFHPLHPQDMSLPFPFTRLFWKKFEKTIEEAPAYWLWSHNRWK